MKWFQKKWRSPQRCTIEPFTLLMAEGTFYNLNDELCILRIEIVIKILKIVKKPLAALHAVLVRQDGSTYDTVGIRQYNVEILMFFLQDSLAHRPASCPSFQSGFYC